MKKIQFEVLGSPAPKGSSRAIYSEKLGRAFNVPSGSNVNRDRMKTWDAAVREAAKAVVGNVTAPPFVMVPLVVTIIFRLARPADHWSKKGGLKDWARDARPHFKPDIDKLTRSTLDAMAGTVFDDDARIVACQMNKIYARPGEEGAWISVKLSEPQPMREATN
jgi:Holliday junction resolvase RusA-like endonuclease